MSHLHARVAVITGVARQYGIGRCLAQRFLQSGYRVVGVDLNIEEDPITSKRTDSLPDQEYSFLQLDIKARDSISTIRRHVKDFSGSQVHVLINNAGISNPYMPHGSSDDEILDAWDAYIGVNLTGAFYVFTAIAPLLADKSSIIHVSSTRARQSEPHSEGYAASKSGLVGLAHAQAVSLSPKTRVNAVLPGWIDTTRDEISEECRKWQLTGDVGVPDDVAELCLFLADEKKSGYITGQEFVIDGGVTKKMVYPEE